MSTFASLGLSAPLLRALDEAGHQTPTPIQCAAIPAILDGGDVLGVADTGTGKTAAFLLPLLQQLEPVGQPRLVVLAPTRELAQQLDASVATYGAHLPLTHAPLVGGVSLRPQAAALQAGVDVVCATPGRLLHLHREGELDLSAVEVLVLDECDQMLDESFRAELSTITELLPRRRTLMFSATLPLSVQHMARAFLTEPALVQLPTDIAAIEQHVLFSEGQHKRAVLAHVLDRMPIDRALVFARTRDKVDKAVASLEGHHPAAALHGRKTHAMRQQALADFEAGRVTVLVATDVASRGLHVEGITHVINLDLPHNGETYVHRIGRTGRAGATGVAVSICDASEGGTLRDIERFTGKPLAPIVDHPFHTWDAVPGSRATASGGPKRSGGRRRRRR